ncbi:cold shock domain-containing protein [Vreelandella rituensis]|uniref:Cold shock domain-containing protein n=1 Tax=Vreelandella rituensis TaxID=2282306 RepID=A0A368U9S5_9GAMM|nr:cold shock domain-containing protein [Halomonas rituensis]RCV93694.1 cold shock domain-containing protein [Halomonas rituensis]
MPSGTIKSYSAQKRYGFIDSEKGESIFFHASNVRPADREKLAAGKIVSFGERPTPKGMAAENVVIEAVAAKHYQALDQTDMIVSKTSACGKGNEVIHRLGRVTVESRDPHAAMDKLKAKARSAGCNALVNLQRDRRTGEAWTNNYKYTIHVLSAEPALVKRVQYTADREQASTSRANVEKEVRQLPARQIADEKVSDASGYSLALSLVGLFIFVMIIFAMGR